MNDYTPMTGEVGIVYTGHETPVVSEAEFDRWLAAHDAEVAAKALEEAARVTYTSGAVSWMLSGLAKRAMDSRAAAIRSTVKTGESE